MTSLDGSLAGPDLPAPLPRRGRLSLFEFMRALRENIIATYAQEAYECDILERNLLGRRRFIVNDPAAIKRICIGAAFAPRSGARSGTPGADHIAGPATAC